MKCAGFGKFLFTVSLSIAICALSHAQRTHTVIVISDEFIPNDLTIEAGDTVLWDWEGGTHNVVNGVGPAGENPDDGQLFHSGPATADTDMTFSVIFDEVGEFPYYCEPHEFLGMRGIVRVLTSRGGTTLCGDFAAIRTEFDMVAAEFPNQDIDADAIPDAFALELLEFGGCADGETRASLRNATRTAYAANLAAIDEVAAMQSTQQKQLILAQYRRVLAALSVLSVDMQEALAVAAEGLEMADLMSVTCEGETCMPQPANAENIDGALQVFALQVFALQTKAANEPYSGDGDYDRDGLSNSAELMTVIDAGGGLPEFIAAATQPEQAEEGQGEGMSEGESEGNGDNNGGCAGAPGLPTSSFSGILTLILLALALSIPGKTIRSQRLKS